MRIISEFKEFAVKGNAVDMAVGIIIGAAFGKIVSSLVSDVIMPPLGFLIGGVNFTQLSFVLKPAQEGLKAVSINYGVFLQAIFDFLIISFAIFFIVKGLNSFKKKSEEAPQAPSVQEELLREIRDLLKNKQS
jgi:large conductance mechanosensitive channel